MEATKTPAVGLSATLCIGSDRYAGKIVAVSATKSVITFEYERTTWHPESKQVRATLRKDGLYRPARCGRGTFLTLGVARDYRDPHF